MKNRAYPTGWTPLHLVPPILFNSMLARRTALRLQYFFFKNIYQLRALMLLNFAYPESHKSRSNLSIKLVPVHSIRLFYT